MEAAAHGISRLIVRVIPPHPLPQVNHEVPQASVNSTSSSSSLASPVPPMSPSLLSLSRSSTATPAFTFSYDPPAVAAVRILGPGGTVSAVGGEPIVVLGTSFSLLPQVRYRGCARGAASNWITRRVSPSQHRTALEV